MKQFGGIMDFNGFTTETVRFFEELKVNNSKEWFERNRQIYEDHVKQKAIEFVIAMGTVLQQEISKNITFEPRINKSIFRLNKDTRFSQDKSPYKSHLGILFWEGERKKLENSGFYFHLEPPKIMMGAGLYMLPKQLMQSYRERVAAGESGKAIKKIVENIKQPPYSVGGSHYKRIPRGYDESSMNTDLLRHNGLWGEFNAEIPEVLFSADLLPYCLEKFKYMAGIHHWFVKYI